jgi:hypothetical protein
MAGLLVEMLTSGVLWLGEVFLSYNGEQLQFLIAFSARRGGEHQQGLRLVLGEQCLTVKLDCAEFGMNECLVISEPLGHVRCHANRYRSITPCDLE